MIVRTHVLFDKKLGGILHATNSLVTVLEGLEEVRRRFIDLDESQNLTGIVLIFLKSIFQQVFVINIYKFHTITCITYNL